MRMLWIVLGVLALMWLGFLTISRNSIELRLDRNEEKFDGLDDRYEMRKDIGVEQKPQNKGIADKVEDRIDTQEDKLDKSIQNPLEDKETIKHIRDLDPKDQKKVKEKSDGEANASNSIVAFEYIVEEVSDTMYQQPVVEAFELKPQDSVVAFKVR